ncbi:MAG: prepilin-type N-terminal cleavage/methylation domain-containing protein [Desulfomonilaceae bacterium]
MKDSKGFTLVEMMVAAGLLTLALAGAMSFFIYQSRIGADSSKMKTARENLTLALSLLQRDIMVAGYGVSCDKTLSLALESNHGVDIVTGDTLGSTDSTQWNVADLPRLVSNPADDPYLPTGSKFSPDKIFVEYGNFLDMDFDINGIGDADTVFKNSATKDIGKTNTGSFAYDLFPIGMDISTNTKPLGGFICKDCGGGSTPSGGEVDWVATGSRPNDNITKSWIFKLITGETLNGTVVPSIVYRIAKYTKRKTYELQRNGIRIAGGDPDMEVYNLTIKDQSSGNSLRFSVRIDYQVMLKGSQEESNAHGLHKKTWHKAWITVEADPRTLVLNAGS